MKHFIYTYEEVSRRNHATLKKARIYRIVRGIPVIVAQGEDTYISEGQLVMMLLEANKLLPAKYFERHPMGGHAYCLPQLEEEGVASVRRVS